MEAKRQKRIVRIIGVGGDGTDGHVRITRGGNFDVYYGSEESHTSMQDTCLRINRELEARGKRLQDLSEDEFLELLTAINCMP